MKVLVLTRYGRLGASSRMRSYQYAPFLEREGLQLFFSPLLRDEYIERLYSKKPTSYWDVLGDYVRQALRLLSVRNFDVVWIEKEIFPNFPAWFEQMLNRMEVPYVVDYDDAIFHNYDLSASPLKRLLAHKIDKVMSGAALVVCGNEYLAERARQAGARRVEIVPTVIDLDRYAVRDQEAPSSPVVIGWIGSPATVKYLSVVAPALQAIALDFPIKLHVIGANYEIPGVAVECIPWSEETEVRNIQRFDIGIMPLLDSPWERGKCGYKLIQYMACGVPVVASPVGVNQKIVDPGTNGYIAGSTEDWISSLRLLCADVSTRRVMGLHGRNKVELEYCIQVTARQLPVFFREAIAQRGV